MSIIERIKNLLSRKFLSVIFTSLINLAAAIGIIDLNIQPALQELALKLITIANGVYVIIEGAKDFWISYQDIKKKTG